MTIFWSLSNFGQNSWVEKKKFQFFFILKDWIVFQDLFSKLRSIWLNKNYERNSTNILELTSVEKLTKYFTIWGKC